MDILAKRFQTAESFDEPVVERFVWNFGTLNSFHTNCREWHQMKIYRKWHNHFDKYRNLFDVIE